MKSYNENQIHNLLIIKVIVVPLHQIPFLVIIYVLLIFYSINLDLSIC